MAGQASALALFDFDGTITTHDTMPTFVRRSVRPARLLLGYVLLAPLILGYKLGWVSGVRVRSAIVRVAYRGVPTAALEAAGLTFAEQYLPHVLREQAMQRIAWHRAQGHTIAVVSGGLDVYLQPWCAAQGLHLICSRLESSKGVLNGRYAGPQCVRAAKASGVRERFDLSRYSTIYAYGDSPEDRDLLELANHRCYRWRELGAWGESFEVG